MRLVAHPNVVDLKAFFYSNGDKVSTCLPQAVRCTSEADNPSRKTKSTSIWSWSSFPRRSTGHLDTTPSSSSPCPCFRSNCICTNSSDHSHTFTRSVSATETSNHRIYFSTPHLVSSSYVISVPLKSSSLVNQTSATSVRDTTELQN